jgi:hypothetical protein
MLKRKGVWHILHFTTTESVLDGKEWNYRDNFIIFIQVLQAASFVDAIIVVFAGLMQKNDY